MNIYDTAGYLGPRITIILPRDCHRDILYDILFFFLFSFKLNRELSTLKRFPFVRESVLERYSWILSSLEKFERAV